MALDHVFYLVSMYSTGHSQLLTIANCQFCRDPIYSDTPQAQESGLPRPSVISSSPPSLTSSSGYFLGVELLWPNFIKYCQTYLQSPHDSETKWKAFGFLGISLSSHGDC